MDYDMEINGVTIETIDKKEQSERLNKRMCIYAASQMTIRDARKATGLTQAGMAELLEIPKITIEQWERDKRKCPEYVRKLIVDKLYQYRSDNAIGQE